MKSVFISTDPEKWSVASGHVHRRHWRDHVGARAFHARRHHRLDALQAHADQAHHQHDQQAEQSEWKRVETGHELVKRGRKRVLNL